MVQFYEVENPLRGLGEGLGRGFEEAFGEGLQYKRNEARFKSAIENVEKDISSGKFENPSEFLMSFIKNVGHLPGGANVVSEWGPSLLQFAQNKGFGDLVGKMAKERKGVSAPQQEPVEQAIASQVQQQQQPPSQQLAPTAVTKEGAVVIQPPTGRAVKEDIVPTNKEPRIQQRQEEVSDQAVKEDIGKYYPITPPIRPEVKPLMSVEDRARYHQQFDPLIGPERVEQNIEQQNRAIQNENDLALQNYQREVDYRQQVQAFSDAQYDRLKSELNPKNKAEETVLNTISKNILGKYEDIKDALPEVRKEFNRFKKMQYDVENLSTLGGTEIARSIISGNPISDETKRKASTLEVLADEYKKYGLEDDFRLDMGKSGWPEAITDSILNPVSECQLSILNHVKKFEPPSGQKIGRPESRRMSRVTQMTGMTELAPESPIVLKKQVEDLKPQLREVMNDPNLKNVSLHIIRQAMSDKGYDWRAFSNALSDLSTQGEIDLGSYDRAIINDMTRPPLEGLESIATNGFFNTLHGWFFGVK